MTSLLTAFEPPISALIERHGLAAHFQPIVDLRAASLYGHEALVRGPQDSALAFPKALFDAARQAGLVTALEFECIRVALTGWAASGVFQSQDWFARCRQMIQRFDERALQLLDPQARTAGGIVSVDQQGEERFHRCTSLAIGIAEVTPHLYCVADEVSAAAGTAKRAAKIQALGYYILPPPGAQPEGNVRAL